MLLELCSFEVLKIKCIIFKIIDIGNRVYCLEFCSSDFLKVKLFQNY